MTEQRGSTPPRPDEGARAGAGEDAARPEHVRTEGETSVDEAVGSGENPD